MKILLYEDVPHPLARRLAEHEVSTVAGVGWGGVKNGELLKLIAQNGYDIFVTGDKNLQHQQAIQDLTFAVVVLSAIQWPVIRRYIPAIAEGINSAEVGTVITVQCGSFLPKRRTRE